jgi:hypothetical protein
VRSVNLFTTKEKKMKKKLFALSGVFLIALVIAGLWAAKAINFTDAQNTRGADPVTLGPGMSMEQMTQEATTIVIGKTVATQSQWVGRSLVTQVTIMVEEALKGDVGTSIKVDVPGGVDYNRKHPIAMTYAGAPQFSLDEKTFLFLYRPAEGDSNYSVIGLSQGKFSIGQADDGGEVVTRDTINTPVQKGAGAIRGNRQVIPMSEFKAMVRRFLNN